MSKKTRQWIGLVWKKCPVSIQQLCGPNFSQFFYPPPSTKKTLWHYRVWSFKSRDTKLERFLPKNQHTKGNYWILIIGLMGSLRVASKNQSFKIWLLFNSSITFGAKIEISGTKWVEKTPIYIFSTFGSKINMFEWKKLEKKRKKIPIT